MEIVSPNILRLSIQRQHSFKDQKHSPPREFQTDEDNIRLLASQKQDISTTTMIKKLIISSLPVILTNMITYLNRTVTLHFLKSAGDLELLGAYGLAGSLITLVSLAIFTSLSTGLTSRAGQAFGGDNFRSVGLYLHRGFLINFIIFVPCSFSFYFADTFCLFLGFDAITSYYIQRMLTLVIPGVFASMAFITLTSYLNGCNIYGVPGAIQIASCVLYWICNYLFIEKWEMGIEGAALSTNIMYISSLIALLAYIAFWDPAPNTLFWFRKESFTGLGEHFKYEVWIGSMVYLELIAYEVIFMFSGRLDTVQFTSITIGYANAGLVYGLPYGFTNTVLAFTGNAVGERNPQKVKTCLKAGVICGVISMVIIELYYIFFSEQVAQFYVNDPATIQATVRCFRAYLIQIPPEFIQLILSSGLRVLGQEKLGTFLMIVGFYFIAIPTSYLLCFVWDMGAIGLILGPAINQYFLLTAVTIVYYKMDWNKQLNTVMDEVQMTHAMLNHDAQKSTTDV